MSNHKYQKKFLYNQINKIFNQNQFIIIGALTHEIRRLLNTKQIYVPRNKVSNLVLKTTQITKCLFQGPIFIFNTNSLSEFKMTIQKLTDANIPIYGAIYEKSLLNFADLKELAFLLKNQYRIENIFQEFQNNLRKTQYAINTLNFLFLSKLIYYNNLSTKIQN